MICEQDGAARPGSTSTSESYDIQPLPGLEEIFQELLKEDGYFFSNHLHENLSFLHS